MEVGVDVRVHVAGFRCERGHVVLLERAGWFDFLNRWLLFFSSLFGPPPRASANVRPGSLFVLFCFSGRWRALNKGTALALFF